jgi:hypothetical protein
MAATSEAVTDAPAVSISYIQWPAVWVGAFIAAAVSFVLITFGSAIGLSVAPLAPTWRTGSVPFSLLSGLWVLVIAIGSAAAGGYVAGRTRTTWRVNHSGEVEFRDGVHGLAVWAVALTLGAILTALSGAALATLPNPLTGDRTSSGGVVGYEVDRLFRSGPDAVAPTPAVRDEASRALVAATNSQNFTLDDRAALVRLVSETTHAPAAVAQSRVDQSISFVREKLRATRHAAIILAFITAAAAAVSSIAALEAARLGGRRRDAIP